MSTTYLKPTSYNLVYIPVTVHHNIKKLIWTMKITWLGTI